MKADSYADIVCHYCGGYNPEKCEKCLGSGCSENYNLVTRDVDWRAYNKIGTNEFTIHDLMAGNMIMLEDEDIPLVSMLLEDICRVAKENDKEFERMEDEDS